MSGKGENEEKKKLGKKGEKEMRRGEGRKEGRKEGKRRGGGKKEKGRFWKIEMGEG